MKKIILITIFTISVGLLTANAQVDEADPKDNTRYEMEMDSLNKEKVMETPTIASDSLRKEMIDSSGMEKPDTTDLRNLNGNDESMRKRSIKNNEMNTEKNRKNKSKRNKQQ